MSTSPTPTRGDWETTRILVVDDDVELCELVDQYLRSQPRQHPDLFAKRTLQENGSAGDECD